MWDHKDDECRELMKAKWQRQGLKVCFAQGWGWGRGRRRKQGSPQGACSFQG